MINSLITFGFLVLTLEILLPGQASAQELSGGKWVIKRIISEDTLSNGEIAITEEFNRDSSNNLVDLSRGSFCMQSDGTYVGTSVSGKKIGGTWLLENDEFSIDSGHISQFEWIDSNQFQTTFEGKGFTPEGEWKNGISKKTFVRIGNCNCTDLTVTSMSPDNGPGTLRSIVDSSCPGDVIRFDESTSGQSIAFNQTNNEILLSKDVYIYGLGPDQTVINANSINRIFNVLPGVNVHLRDLRLQNANASENGGAIYNQGNLNIENVILRNNKEAGVPKAYSGQGSIYLWPGTVRIED